ncbi:hypothetical protein GJ496_001877 [Pomphorhynchus laevis]|nr:hypothetical protein GJ496_001877 [Pomphorhynchus laevis]
MCSVTNISGYHCIPPPLPNLYLHTLDTTNINCRSGIYGSAFECVTSGFGNPNQGSVLACFCDTYMCNESLNSCRSFVQLSVYGPEYM